MASFLSATARRSVKRTFTRSAVRHGLEPFEIGRDSITAISPDYSAKGSFPFSGQIENVTFELAPKR
jgi:arylsulfatase